MSINYNKETQTIKSFLEVDADDAVKILERFK